MKAHFTLESGGTIPSVGLGTWQLEGEDGHEAILYALKNGYRMIDAAYAYNNQKTVGLAIKESCVPRDEIFIIDKLANTWHTAAEECLELTLKALGVDYLDCWLMHWPSPLNHKGNDKKTPKLADGSIDFEKEWTYVDTWREMIRIQKKFSTKVRSIGVANFGIKELENIITKTGVKPEINQVELHPANNQQNLFDYCKKMDIQLVAYSPLGSIGSPLLQSEELNDIAEKRGISVAQLILSWGVESGWPVLPRSKSPERLSANLTLVSLTSTEIAKITSIGLAHKQRFIQAPWHDFVEE